MVKRFKSFLKYIGICVFQIFVRGLHIIPLKDNRIVFISYHGLQYSCNPRYISEYLEKRYPGMFDIIWLIDSPEQYRHLNFQGVKFVRCGNLRKFICGLTAKIIVINAGQIYAWMPPRRDQLLINTWHGGGYYKLCGVSESKKATLDKRIFVLASKHTSYFLSTNQCFTNNEIRKDFEYSGNILNIGFPRNDIFFISNYSDVHKNVCSYFGIKETVKILMYAPTNRYSEAAKFVLPDFKKLKEILKTRFGGEWAVLVRMHYYNSNKLNCKDTYDASYRPGSPEMQELMAASDILISDYSSCIWDYSFTYRPCFLFAPDLDEYIASRGFGIDIYEWGFPVCKTEQELWDAIGNFDEDDFRKKMESHHENLGSFEHGNATEIMGKLIYDFCYPDKKANP